MRNLSKAELGHFGFSLILALAGTVVSVLHAVQIRDVNFELMVAFIVAYMLVDAMSVRLARGDKVFVDGAIALASVLLLPPAQAVVSCVLGVAAGGMFDTRNGKPLLLRLGEILRRPLLVAGLAVLSGALLDRPALADGQTTALSLALALGMLHSFADFALLVIGMSLERHLGLVSSASGLARPLVALYAAHASLGVVAALLYPSGRVWALSVMLVLVLLIQYSFNLLLKTKGAYEETIQALVRASELQSGATEAGHAQRVADRSVLAGRLLGLNSQALERLNYAALLHEIGLIGLDEATPGPDEAPSHPTRGAEIVGGIPFLASTQMMIKHQSTRAIAQELELTDEDALCAELIGVCCALDHWTVCKTESVSGPAPIEGLRACAVHASPAVREAVTQASARMLRVPNRAV